MRVQAFLKAHKLGLSRQIGMQVARLDHTPTLLLTREIEEHANVFHTMTDLLNAFLSLRVLGWESDFFQVLLLDSHPTGPLDPIWTATATSNGRLAPKGRIWTIKRNTLLIVMTFDGRFLRESSAQI